MAQYTILVIDDEIDFLGIIAKDLEDIGIEVYTASNGVDALDFIQNHPNLDSVLCDVKMPGLNGIELLKKVRLDSQTKDLKFILMSGYPEVFDDLDPSLRPDGTLIKPIDMNEFNQLIGI